MIGTASTRPPGAAHGACRRAPRARAWLSRPPSSPQLVAPRTATEPSPQSRLAAPAAPPLAGPPGHLPAALSRERSANRGGCRACGWEERTSQLFGRPGVAFSALVVGLRNSHRGAPVVRLRQLAFAHGRRLRDHPRAVALCGAELPGPEPAQGDVQRDLCPHLHHSRAALPCRTQQRASTSKELLSGFGITSDAE